MICGAKEKLTHEDNKSPPLDNQGKKCTQGIVGALLYYDRAVDNKFLFGLSSIESQQAATTERTKEEINQLLDYCDTYPANGILYGSSNMVLCAHSDAGFHNERKGCSRAGDHMFLSKDDTIPQWNGLVLTLAHIIKFVTSSTPEAELGTNFVTAQEMVVMRNTLEEMKWPQTKSPI